MKPLALFWVVLVLAFPASATQAPVELGMVVTGAVTVDPDGSVKAYTIDHADQLPSGVRHLLQTTIPGWTFDAIKSAHATAPTSARMSVRVQGTVIGTSKQKIDGKQVEQNTVQIGVAGIALQCPPPHVELTYAHGCDPAANLRYWPEDKPPALPQYPAAAAALHAGGAVHLYLDVDSAGHIMQAAVGRVDLYMLVPHPDKLRKLFGDAALRATQDWQFNVPTAGPQALAGHWVAAQTVGFMAGSDHAGSVGYGKWLAFQPGPSQAIAWVDEDPAAVIRLPDMLVHDPHAQPGQ